MGNERMFDGSRGNIQWVTRECLMGHEGMFDGSRGYIQWDTGNVQEGMCNGS